MKTVTVTRGFSFNQSQYVSYGLLNLIGFPTVNFSFDVGDAEDATISSPVTGQPLVWNGSAWVNGSLSVSYVPVMQGAAAAADGVKGLVPQPVAGQQDHYLSGDGTFKALPSNAPTAGIYLYLNGNYR